MKKKKAFTLMELVIVVVIVGVLASLAIPNYFKTVVRAKQRNAIVQMNVIRTANIQYKSRHGQWYPAAWQGLANFSGPLGINISPQGINYVLLSPWITDIPNGFLILADTPNFAYTNNPREFRLEMSDGPLTDPKNPPACANPCCADGDCEYLGDCCYC